MWLYESINIYLKSKSDVYFKMKSYTYVLMGTINNTSNSAVLKWQHIFHHPVWVQTKTRTKENHRNRQFRMESHVEKFHGNSWEFGMALFDNVSVPNPIYMLFVNWKIKTCVNFLCSNQILYLARWVVKYAFSFSTARGIAIVDSSYYLELHEMQNYWFSNHRTRNDLVLIWVPLKAYSWIHTFMCMKPFWLKFSL